MHRKRTMAMYESAGQQFRSIIPLLSRLYVTASEVLTSAERKQLSKALAVIDKTRSLAEDRMFRDFPNLPDEALKVFYDSDGENYSRLYASIPKILSIAIEAEANIAGVTVDRYITDALLKQTGLTKD